MTEIEFVGYSAVHPSDFIYDVPNGFTGYLLRLFDSPSELLIDGRLMRTLFLICLAKSKRRLMLHKVLPNRKIQSALHQNL